MITTEHIENVYGRVSDAHGIPVQSDERRAEFRRWFASEIEKAELRGALKVSRAMLEDALAKSDHEFGEFL